MTDRVPMYRHDGRWYPVTADTPELRRIFDHRLAGYRELIDEILHDADLTIEMPGPD